MHLFSSTAIKFAYAVAMKGGFGTLEEPRVIEIASRRLTLEMSK